MTAPHSAQRHLLLWTFDQLYTRFAWGYDIAALVAGAGLWYHWVEQALPYVSDGPVLEVGFGRGHLLPKLRERGLSVIGLDASAQMVRHVAPRHRTVVQGVAEALPFSDGHFATLITTFPAPFIVAEASQYEFARVLRPEGRWLWVDAPQFTMTTSTLLSSALNRALSYQTEPEARRVHVHPALWRVIEHRPTVGPSSVGVLEMWKV